MNKEDCKINHCDIYKENQGDQQTREWFEIYEICQKMYDKSELTMKIIELDEEIKRLQANAKQ